MLLRMVSWAGDTLAGCHARLAATVEEMCSAVCIGPPQVHWDAAEHLKQAEKSSLHEVSRDDARGGLTAHSCTANQHPLAA
jgi:hypothetical protein